MTCICLACGSAPRMARQPAPPPAAAPEAQLGRNAHRPRFQTPLDDPEWGRLAEAEIRANFEEAGPSFRIECRGDRCRVEVASDRSDGLQEALYLPDCAVSRLGHPEGAEAFLVDCWSNGSRQSQQQTRASLEARLREWADRFSLHARLRSVSCQDGTCHVEIWYADRAAARADEEDEAEAGHVLGGLAEACGGRISGLEPAADGAGLVRTIEMSCPGRGWSTHSSEYEERAGEEDLLARLRAEPRDTPWADATERTIREEVTRWLTPSIALERVECADGRCRVDLAWERGGARRSQMDLRGALTLEGCIVSPLARAGGSSPGFTLAIDCAWPTRTRPAEWRRATEAALRRQFDSFVEEQRTAASIHRVECRTTKCIVQLSTAPGRESDGEIHDALRSVGGCHSHAGGSHGGLQYSLLSCTR